MDSLVHINSLRSDTDLTGEYEAALYNFRGYLLYIHIRINNSRVIASPEY